ncbi:transformer-2 protein homolog alpha isoform X3 [Petaurus breviceps papuanus]|uniref:transformer-2 protein homolog alpha isoform X3 n=1 Tax=Petaurus breviceps papuanus TaxID=3040969 RepID=UPI0036DC30FE
MSDVEENNFEGRESRSQSKSPAGSPARVKSESRSASRSPSRASKHSESHSRSRSKSRSRSRRHSHRRYTRSRSHSHSHRRRSRSRSYTPEYRRRRSRSHSPMSNRRRHTGSRANPDPNTCLGVFGLSLYTTERDLREVFSRYGPLSGVNVVYDQRTGRSRGFAFVYFERIDDSKEAMERANGMELDGRRIRVDYSITKRAAGAGTPTTIGATTAATTDMRNMITGTEEDHLLHITVAIDHGQDPVPIAQDAIDELNGCY